MAKQRDIPVYLFTGFLEAGKTRFIQETLEDRRFCNGERTLLLICEEGEEEYDLSTYPHKSVFLEVIDQENVTTEALAVLAEQHHARRVIVELNGMQMIEPFYRKMPEDWELAQEVMFADANTILSFIYLLSNVFSSPVSFDSFIVSQLSEMIFTHPLEPAFNLPSFL